MNVWTMTVVCAEVPVQDRLASRARLAMPPGSAQAWPFDTQAGCGQTWQGAVDGEQDTDGAGGWAPAPAAPASASNIAVAAPTARPSGSTRRKSERTAADLAKPDTRLIFMQ